MIHQTNIIITMVYNTPTTKQIFQSKMGTKYSNNSHISALMKTQLHGLINNDHKVIDPKNRFSLFMYTAKVLLLRLPCTLLHLGCELCRVCQGISCSLSTVDYFHFFFWVVNLIDQNLCTFHHSQAETTSFIS